MGGWRSPSSRRVPRVVSLGSVATGERAERHWARANRYLAGDEVVRALVGDAPLFVADQIMR